MRNILHTDFRSVYRNLCFKICEKHFMCYDMLKQDHGNSLTQKDPYRNFSNNLTRGISRLNKRNYQKELDRLIENITKKREKCHGFFLHSCCAPCSSYVLEYLSQYFEITVFFYNPNISLEEEYRKRVAEIRTAGSGNVFYTSGSY